MPPNQESRSDLPSAEPLPELRKRASQLEAELSRIRSSEDLLRAAVDQAPFPVQFFAMDGLCVFANQAWEELWGASRDLAADYNILADTQLEAKGLQPRIRKAFDGELSLIPPVPYDPAKINKPGPLRWIGAVLFPIRNPAGKVVLVVLVLQDLVRTGWLEEELARGRRELEERLEKRTQELTSANAALEQQISVQKTVEDRLRLSQSRLSEAEKIAHLGSWEWDVQTNKLTWSDELYRIYGLQPQEFEVTYEALLNLIHPDDRAQAQSTVQRALETLQPFSFDHRIVRSTGEIRILNGRGEVMVDGQGNPLRVIGTGLDVTEQWLVQQALEAANDQLEQRVKERTRELEEANRLLQKEIRERLQAEESIQMLNAELEMRVEERTAELARYVSELKQFAYVTSHDLREPLRTVASFSQLLSKRSSYRLGEEGQEFLRFIVEGVHRMNELIEALLSYSKLDDVEISQPVDMDEVLGAALSNLQESITASEAIVRVQPLPVVDGDRVMLAQIFQNLIGNAIKYRSERPLTIETGARRLGNFWEFWVRDNGVGINPAYSERIFGIFKRLHGRELPGTGIGLAICRKIVEQHGGTIRVESTPGEGATFYFTLPAE